MNQWRIQSFTKGQGHINEGRIQGLNLVFREEGPPEHRRAKTPVFSLLLFFDYFYHYFHYLVTVTATAISDVRYSNLKKIVRKHICKVKKDILKGTKSNKVYIFNF